MMATCQIIQKKPAEGLRYSEAAKAVYPQEAQAYYLSGFAKLQTRNFAGAHQDFSAYEKVLPGNPTTAFFKGFSLEGMGNKQEAAKEYHRYLQVVQEGKCLSTPMGGWWSGDNINADPDSEGQNFQTLGWFRCSCPRKNLRQVKISSRNTLPP
jgi:tetratricopeptide (TPR) repeat protein